MESKEQLQRLTYKYRQCFPEEKVSPDEFFDFVEHFSGFSLYDRKNPAGHITVSAVVCDPAMERFLLLRHRQLGKWLQPGGHVEWGDVSLLSGAFREVEEETGIPPSGIDVMGTSSGFEVFNLESHPIPGNPAKGEGAHYHHDVRFLFRLKWPADISIDPAEAESYMWATREEYAAYSGRSGLFGKLGLFDKTL